MQKMAANWITMKTVMKKRKIQLLLKNWENVFLTRMISSQNQSKMIQKQQKLQILVQLQPKRPIMRPTYVTMSNGQPLPCPPLWQKNIAKVIGETEDVKLLDRLGNKLRNNSSSINLQEDYKKQLAHVQTKVLGKHSQAAKSFKEWEKLFTSMNNYIEPSLDDIQNDEKGYILYRTLRLCRQLLQHWNITLHL